MFTVKHLLGVVHIMLNDAVAPLQINDDELFSIFKQEIDLLSFIDKRLFAEERCIKMCEGTVQYLPNDCNSMIKLLHNIDDKCNVGRAITYADKDLLTQRFPNWRSDNKKDVVYNYMIGENKKTYEVYPPQVKHSKNSVIAVFQINPVEKLTIDSELSISDSYIKVLSHAVAGGYLLKDTADEENLRLGMEYQKMAVQYLKTIGA